jgi:hypothetical protein
MCAIANHLILRNKATHNVALLKCIKNIVTMNQTFFVFCKINLIYSLYLAVVTINTISRNLNTINQSKPNHFSSTIALWRKQHEIYFTLNMPPFFYHLKKYYKTQYNPSSLNKIRRH